MSKYSTDDQTSILLFINHSSAYEHTFLSIIPRGDRVVAVFSYGSMEEDL